MSVYLLTGATGVVGSAIVPVLMRKTDAEILLLVRPGRAQSSEARLVELFDFWSRYYPGLDRRTLSARIRAVKGEITEQTLGLSATDQGYVRAHCTHIIHCAASVRMNLPLAEARETARQPVARVLALGETCARLEKVDFVSTVGVGGRWDGPLPERWLDEPRDFHNTYEAAKAEAEDLIREAVSRGFPATVHRPSMVVGDSHSGAVIHFQIFYFICDFLSGRRTLGFYPALGAGTLDIVPNDYVAEAIVASSLDAQSRGRILHLCAGPEQALRLTDLRRTVRGMYRAAGRLSLLPSIDLSARGFMRLMQLVKVFLPGRERRALQTLPLYLDYLAGVQAFGNTESLAQIEAWGITAPASSGVAERALAFYLQR